MRKLILVRHSLPEIVPDLPARQWHLSDEGRLRCRKLAEALAGYDLGVVVSSVEPKAMETGRIVASVLGTPSETAPNLHEHDRRGVQFTAEETVFQEQVARFFSSPRELVYGAETADGAHRRFAAAIDRVVERRPDMTLAVVAHGSVITLFVARAAGLEPMPFWKKLGLPSFVVLSLPGFELLQVVEAVGGE